jgi:hypothetical protein
MNREKGGKMNFEIEGRKVPYTIVNIPHSGVYLGVCYSFQLFYLFFQTIYYYFFIVSKVRKF